MIRRYLAWIAVVVVLTFVASIIGAFAIYADRQSQSKVDDLSCIIEGTY